LKPKKPSNDAIRTLAMSARDAFCSTASIRPGECKLVSASKPVKQPMTMPTSPPMSKACRSLSQVFNHEWLPCRNDVQVNYGAGSVTVKSHRVVGYLYKIFHHSVSIPTLFTHPKNCSSNANINSECLLHLSLPHQQWKIGWQSLTIQALKPRHQRNTQDNFLCDRFRI
jgi:hypothetical protein